jgi:hypothetical protein
MVSTSPMAHGRTCRDIRRWLKKITPAAQAGLTGSQSSAPTIAAMPRGSQTMAVR